MNLFSREINTVYQTSKTEKKNFGEISRSHDNECEINYG